GGGDGGRGAGIASAAQGAALFRSKGCGSCHDAPGWTSPIGLGPSLRDAAAWAGERRDGMGARRYLAESIDDPGAFTSPAWRGGQGPIGAMPAVGLDAAEVEAVVEYLVRG